MKRIRSIGQQRMLTGNTSDGHQAGATPIRLKIRTALTALLACAVVAHSGAVLSASSAKEGQSLAEIYADSLVRPNDVKAPTLLIETTEPGAYLKAVEAGTNMHAVVKGPIANVTVTKSFRNTLDRSVRGVFVFRSPGALAPAQIEVTIGGRNYIGRLSSRLKLASTSAPTDTQSKSHRASAPQSQLTKALEATTAKHPKPQVYKLPAIGAGEAVTVRATYTQLVDQQAMTHSLTLPLAQTEYVTRAAAKGASRYAARNDPLSKTQGVLPPANPVRISVELIGSIPRESITAPHNWIIKRSSKTDTDHTYVSLVRNSWINPARNFTLTWQPTATLPVGLTGFSHTHGDKHYLLAQLSLSDLVSASSINPPRELIFVLDKSDSSAGRGLEFAKPAVIDAINALRPGDKFNILSYNKTAEFLLDEAVPATTENKAYAARVIQLMIAAGPSKPLVALDALLDHMAATPTKAERQVVFLTDGTLRGSTRTLTKLARARGTSSQLHILKIGDRTPTPFLKKATEIGRGTYHEMNIGTPVTQKIKALTRSFGRAHLTDLQATWPTGVHVEAFPKALPAVSTKTPLTLVAELSALRGAVTLSGKLNGRPWTGTIDLASALRVDGINRIWARRKIVELASRQMSNQSTTSIAAEIATTALHHDLETPLTQRAISPAYETELSAWRHIVPNGPTTRPQRHWRLARPIESTPHLKDQQPRLTQLIVAPALSTPSTAPKALAERAELRSNPHGFSTNYLEKSEGFTKVSAVSPAFNPHAFAERKQTKAETLFTSPSQKKVQIAAIVLLFGAMSLFVIGAFRNLRRAYASPRRGR